MAPKQLYQTKSSCLQSQVLCTDHGPRGASQDLGDGPGVRVAEVKLLVVEGTTRYAGLLLAPAEGIYIRLRHYCMPPQTKKPLSQLF